MVNIISNFAADAGGQECRRDAVAGYVAHGDITGIRIRKADLAVIAANRFNGDITDVHVNTLVPNGFGQERTVDFISEPELSLKFFPTGSKLLFHLHNLPAE